LSLYTDLGFTNILSFKHFEYNFIITVTSDILYNIKFVNTREG